MADARDSAPSAAPPEEVEDEARRGWWIWLILAGVFVAIVAAAIVMSRPQGVPEVYLHQIVVRVNPEVEGDRERARAKIERVREELLKPGKSFAVVAMLEGESLDAKQDNPGEVGWVSRGIVPPYVEEVAFSLKIEEISPIIEDPHGFRIIKISDKRGFPPE